MSHLYFNVKQVLDLLPVFYYRYYLDIITYNAMLFLSKTGLHITVEQDVCV